MLAVSWIRVIMSVQFNTVVNVKRRNSLVRFWKDAGAQNQVKERQRHVRTKNRPRQSRQNGTAKGRGRKRKNTRTKLATVGQ